ncbi:hypothetical protein [Paludisphaera rhizosphaerae]|uniref:hypothetical protein n=1 Tax=Paludisphaera rhizosphaerae TaxID=2711216 RepID=UPI0013EDB0AF|nr:hypothetical protein [Paludisphaera rhizosphaerae]
MATEVCYLVKEDHHGVPVADPEVGTDAFYLKLSEPNSFSMAMNPTIGTIGRGNGDSGISCFYSAQTTCTGNLQGELYPSLAKFLCDWAMTPINSARTAPWATTAGTGSLPIGDLASVSIYHAYYIDALGAWIRKRYSGVKVLSGSIAASTSDPIAKFNFALQGIRNDLNAAGTVADPDATEFPLPTDADYPCGPFLYVDLAGGLKIATSRTDFGSVNFAWASTIAPQFFESRYVRSLRYKGRGSSTQLTVDLLLQSMTDETAYQTLVKQDSHLKFDNGTNSLTIDLNGNNVFNSRTRNLDYNGPFLWQGVLLNGFDAAVGSDLTVSAT